MNGEEELPDINEMLPEGEAPPEEAGGETGGSITGGGGSWMPSDIAQPWMEDLFKYMMRYNLPLKGLNEAWKLIEKAASAGDYDTALNVLSIMISNASSPPIYLSPVPTDARVLDIRVIDPKEASRLGLHREGASTVVVAIAYKMPGSDQPELIVWKLHWYTGLEKFYTEPASLLEVDKVKKHLGEEEAGSRIENEGWAP